MMPGEEFAEKAKGHLHYLPSPPFRGTAGTSCCSPSLLALTPALRPAAEVQTLVAWACPPRNVGGSAGGRAVQPRRPVQPRRYRCFSWVTRWVLLWALSSAHEGRGTHLSPRQLTPPFSRLYTVLPEEL